MKKIAILALALVVALVAAPAFASVQNIKVSGSIDSHYIYRDNFDLGSVTTSPSTIQGNIEDTNQHLFATQTTLRVDADLTDQVSTVVQLLNERAWEQSPAAAANDIDLNLAYVTLREMLYSPLTVVVGRQQFAYGNSFVLDATGTNNVATADSGFQNIAEDLSKSAAMDAIRLIFDYNPLTLEVLYSKVDTGTPGASFTNVTDDVDLYGINSTYELGDDMNSQVEAYFFTRINKATNPGTGGGEDGTKSDTIYLPGLRASADILDGLNVQGEMAWQRGNRVSSSSTVRDNEKREAMAAQFISNYQIPKDLLPDSVEQYNPALQYVYTYVSGDSNPDDRAENGTLPGGRQSSEQVYSAWDPFFENQSGGKIYNALFDLTNSHIHAVAFTANPMEDVTTKLTWTGIWLDKKIDDGSASSSTFPVRQPNTTAGVFTANATTDKSIGYEIDFDTIYDYTEDVQIGASLGWFVPGDTFAANNDSMASQALVHGNVNF